MRLTHSVGRGRKRVRVHAQVSYGSRRFERGTTFPIGGYTTIHGDGQANILINRSHRACLADFGLSTIASIEHRAAANASSISVASNASLMSFAGGGTTRWMSPELLDPDRFGAGDGRPTKQSDCYALGMVVYEVRTDAISPPSKRLDFDILSGSLWEPSFLGYREQRVTDIRDNGGRPTGETKGGREPRIH